MEPETARPVSVVIPTTGHRASLLASVQSALDQPEVAEVVVVYNGGLGDQQLLATCADRDRVRLLTLSDVRGCGPARQAGVEQARHDWISFLDDDDVWLPGKLGRQLAAASPGVRLVLSRALWRLPERDKVLPQRPPAPGETLADFAFVVGSWARHGLVSPPTLLVSRSLLEEVPWWPPGADLALDRHEDMQWAARVSAVLAPAEWVQLDSVDVLVHRDSPGSMGAAARGADVAAAERRWLDVLSDLPRRPLAPGGGDALSPRALAHFRLTHIWPHTPRLSGPVLGDALRAPWAAAVGLRRRVRAR